MDKNFKKKNNVWSDTLIEESLCSDINGLSSLCANNENVIKVNNRDVESYEYPAEFVAKEANTTKVQTSAAKRNHLEIDPSLVNFIKAEKVAAKVAAAVETQPVKARLGELVAFDENKSRSHILVSEIDSEELVAKEIAKYLKEDNFDLIQRCVKHLGRKKALEILYATEDIQEQGGMLTSDGYRKRSPGGVFIQLVRKDDTILNCQRKNIFIDDFLKKKKQKQMKRLVQRKKFEKAKEDLSKKIELESRLDFSGEISDEKQPAAENTEDFDNFEEENMIYFEE